MAHIDYVEHSAIPHADVVHTAADRLNLLPRSVVRPDDYVLLDGLWQAELDRENRGLAEQWYLGHAWATQAQWPQAIEESLAAIKQPSSRARPQLDQVVAWYERRFEVPKVWMERPNRLVQLTFGACGNETRVWLNGHLLRTVEDEEVNYGEYTSFSYELPHDYLLPVNRLTVRIADSLDADIPRGKQASRVYKRGGIWYQTVSGPIRSVWIEPVERNRLRSRLEVSSVVEDRLVQFRLTTRVHDPGSYLLRLVVLAGHEPTEPLAVVEHPLRLDEGQRAQWVALQLPGASLWSPAAPNLHHLVGQLTSPAGDVSQIETHFGLRKIEARGRKVYLNDEQLYLDGILYQPATATYDQVRRHMLALKALGCNLVRVHIAGIDPRIYDLADALGLLLWVEVPSPHRSSQRSRENHRAELGRMLAIILSHPSVAILSLYNESWGAEDIATKTATRSYIAELYANLHVQHPQILVVDNDGWQHVSTEGRLLSDLLTAHLYTPDLERWRELLDRLASGETTGVAVEPLVVGDPFFYQGQVPIVVSEWGGFGWSGYGGPGGRAAKAERIRAFKQELRRHDIAGDVYTQAVSIEDETNGLVDMETGAHDAPANLLGSGDEAPRADDSNLGVPA